MADTHPFDAELDLYRNQHRRIVLAVLAEEGRSLTMNDLAKAILKYNHQTSVTEVPEDVMTGIRCSLHHSHLPKLAAAGVIDYDTDRQLVEPADDFAHETSNLAAVLDADPHLEPPVEL